MGRRAWLALRAAGSIRGGLQFQGGGRGRKGGCRKPWPGELAVGGCPSAGCCLGPVWGFAGGYRALQHSQTWREAPPGVTAADASQLRSAAVLGLATERGPHSPELLHVEPPVAPWWKNAFSPPISWLLCPLLPGSLPTRSPAPPYPAPPAVTRARHDVCDAMPLPMTLPPRNAPCFLPLVIGVVHVQTSPGACQPGLARAREMSSGGQGPSSKAAEQ